MKGSYRMVKNKGKGKRGGSSTIVRTKPERSQFTEIAPGLVRFTGQAETHRIQGALVAVDTSGSTDRGVLARELTTVRYFAPPYIAWSHQIEGIFSTTTSPQWRSGGGTDPSSLFTHPQTIQLLQERRALVMTTDGQINQREITQFANLFGRMSHITVCVGVLVCSLPRGNANYLNISVFSPFMNRDCLIVWCDPYVDGAIKVVYANGGFTSQFPTINLDDPEDLPTLTSQQLAELSVTSMPSPGDGYTALGGGTFVHLERLLGSKIDMDQFTHLDWDALLLICKTRNLLDRLRVFILKHKPVVEADPQPSQASEIVQLMQRIRQVSDNGGSSEQIRTLRDQLHQLRAAEQAQIQAERGRVRHNMQSLVQFHSELMEQLHEIQRADYNLAGVRSNRAARAKIVTGVQWRDNFLKGAYRAEDEIFGDEDTPMCVLVRAPEDPSFNTGDHALTFPLSITNREMQCPDFVGVESGQELVRSGQDLSRQPIAGMIPFLNIRRPEVREYMYQELCRLFTANRDMKVVWRLFFAFLWHLSCREFSSGPVSRNLRDACRWMMDQIMDLHHTTPNFSEIGDKIPLRQALGPFIGLPEFQQYECAGCILIFEVVYHFQLDGKPLDGGVKYLRERMMRDLVQRLLALLKKGGEIRGALERALFEFRCGVPTMGTGRLVDGSGLRLLLEELGLGKLWRGHVDDIPKLMPEHITVVLASFLGDRHWANYRAETLFAEFLQNGVFASTVQGDLDTERVVEMVNQRFEDMYTIPYQPPPRFVTPFGASVMEDERNGVSFIPEDSVESLSVLSERVRATRAEYFRNLYHTEETAPTATSSAFHLHKAIHCALAADPHIEITRETILRVLVVIIAHSKGNIYEPTLLLDILHGVWSYSHVHVPLEVAPSFNERGPSVEEKLRMEMELRGATLEDVGYRFVEVFPLPVAPPIPSCLVHSDLVAPLTEEEIRRVMK